MNFDSRELIKAKVLALGEEIISLMTVSLTMTGEFGSSGFGGLKAGAPFAGLAESIEDFSIGSGRGTGTGVKEGFGGKILGGEGSSLGIFTLSLFIKSSIRPKFFEPVKAEKILAPAPLSGAPGKISEKLKLPAKAEGVFKKPRPVNKNTTIKDNLFRPFISVYNFNKNEPSYHRV